MTAAMVRDHASRFVDTGPRGDDDGLGADI